MKKMNNKGFAITVMLYSVLTLAAGLILLILATMSGSRKNNNELILNIKNDLNNASYGKAIEFTASEESQEYTVTKEGYYRIELYGAAGASGGVNGETVGIGGKGAYTSGIIHLQAGQKLYFYVGKKGDGGCSPYTSCSTKRFNGGGLGGYYTVGASQRFASGGSATDVRLIDGTWDNSTSLRSRIMVAAGGGSSDDINTGSNGGTLMGEKGNERGEETIAGGGAGQTYGGSSGRNAGSFGMAGDGYIAYPLFTNCNDAFGGGSGYYGGGGGVSGNPSGNALVNGICMIRGYSGGGSSFISGYAGVNAMNNTNPPTHTNNTIHYSGLYFENGMMASGVNDGDGKATIRYIGAELGKVSENLNRVRYIRDCIQGNSINEERRWMELQAIRDGINVAQGRSVTATFTPTATGGAKTTLSTIVDGKMDNNEFIYGGTSGNQCITVDLGSVQELDEVAVWHYFDDKRSYNNHTLSVSENNSTWIPLIDNRSGYEETPNGIRYSSYRG